MKRIAALVGLVLLLTSLAPAAPSAATRPATPLGAPVWLDASADVGVSTYRQRETTSNGRGPTTPLRQNQNWGGFATRALLINFDTEPVKGWAISKAYLHLYLAKGDLYGLGLTEVLAPWVEPRTVNFTTRAGGLSWLFARTPKEGDKPAAGDWWAWPGSSLASVCWAHPSARYQFIGPEQIERTRVGEQADQPAKPGRDRFIHLRVPVEPELVAALAAGVAHGLAITDDKGQVAEGYSLLGPGLPYVDNDAEDPYVFTRDVQEPSLRPRLEVYGAKVTAAAPGAPIDLKVTRTDLGESTVYLEFTAPAVGLLAYEASYKLAGSADWTPLPRWAMLRPAAAGGKQTLPVWTLPPGEYELSLRAVDLAGTRGPQAVVKLVMPARPALAFADPPPVEGRAPSRPLASGPDGAGPSKQPADDFTLAAVPDLAKVDPVSGAVLRFGDQYKEDAAYLRSNAAFTGQGVTLSAAANEVAAFQLIVGRKAKDLAGVKVEVSDLLAPGGGKIAAQPNAQAFRVWYIKTDSRRRSPVGPGQADDRTVRPVGWHGDACLPLAAPFDEAFDLPAADNGVPGQTNQAVWIDLFVPKATPAGVYTGQIKVTAGSAASVLPVVLEVLPLALPDAPSWRVDLNCYGQIVGQSGGRKGRPATTQAEYSYYRLAKAHRQMVNALPYHQDGVVDTNGAPTLAGAGAGVKVADWSAWDACMAPLLDGSAFTAENGYVGPGAGTPISHLYLPFHENWPLPLAKYYGDYAQVADRLDFADWSKKFRPLAQAFSRDYQDGFASVARQFAEHFQQKGWTATEFQFFLNNKYYYKTGYFSTRGGRGSSFWLLDESVDHDDYAANAFFLGLARKGVASANAPGVKFAYRTDVSMPEMTRGLFDSVCDFWMLGWETIPDGYVTTAAVRRKFIPDERFWHYGGAVGTSGAPIGLENSFLAGWCSGSDGILPYWHTTGGNWAENDDLAVFYTGHHYANGKKNYPGALPGLRMKVMRRCQQDIEYLQLLSQAKGWDRGLVRQAIAAYADDPAAPTLMFRKLTPERADQLRSAVARTLVGRK